MQRRPGTPPASMRGSMRGSMPTPTGQRPMTPPQQQQMQQQQLRQQQQMQQQMQQQQQNRGPAPPTTKLPINSFPPDVQAALQKSWDRDNKGYVTVGELTAGANGGMSSRNAQQQRTLAGLGQHRAPAQQQGKPGSATGQTKFYTELPGDLSVLDSLGLAEGQGIWERMAAIIRRQRLDVRILLDAHDRRNAGLVDTETFRRALCYAFGNHWIELAMTSDEFEELVKPYLTRRPQKPGDPPGFVFWQKFATDLQTLADRRTHSDDFMARLVKIEAKERVAAKVLKDYGVTEDELRATFAQLKHTLNYNGGGGSSGVLTTAFRRMDQDHSGTVGAPEVKKFLLTMQRGMEELVNIKVLDAIIDLCDADGDGQIDYGEVSKMILCDDIVELLALVPDKTKVHKGQSYLNQAVGSRGVTIGELQKSQQAIKTFLTTKYKDVSTALRMIDTKRDGSLTRDEIKAMLEKNQLLKHVDYNTGAVRGEITMAAADTLMDLVDVNGDGKFDYREFTRVLVAEDIMHVPVPKSTNSSMLWGDGR
jgi:Ca2+-binding EF-hand superfamily protein